MLKDLPLTDRQLQVATMAASGLTSRQLGDELRISTQTVKNHLTTIFLKTGTKNRIELAAWYMQNHKEETAQ